MFERVGNEDPEKVLFEEIKQVGVYLAHKRDVATNWIEKAKVEIKLEVMKKSYVAQQFHDFYKEARLVKEWQMWE